MISEEAGGGGGEEQVPVQGGLSNRYHQQQLKLGSTAGFWEPVQNQPESAQLPGEAAGR